MALGTWKSKPGQVYAAVKEAITAGYRHIDCAPAYGNESEVGAAIGETIKAGTVTREDLWVTSKLWNNAHQPDQVLPALLKTLHDLRLDYLDLFLIHWPVAFKAEVSYPRSREDWLWLWLEGPLTAALRSAPLAARAWGASRASTRGAPICFRVQAMMRPESLPTSSGSETRRKGSKWTAGSRPAKYASSFSSKRRRGWSAGWMVRARASR